jgi:hypothetical protein
MLLFKLSKMKERKKKLCRGMKYWITTESKKKKETNVFIFPIFQGSRFDDVAAVGYAQLVMCIELRRASHSTSTLRTTFTFLKKIPAQRPPRATLDFFFFLHPENNLKDAR